MPTEDTRHTQRQRIREHARVARQALTPEDRIRLSRAACDRLAGALSAPLPRTVLGYAATNEELDPAALLDALRDAGSQIVYPRITGPHTLSLHLCEPNQLEPGPLGILQPCEGAPPISHSEIDLVIAPGIAFDAHGNRLGYGGGYYDRLLAQMPHVRRIGLCYDGQLTELIPGEPHDVRMHVVVTPSRLFRSPLR